MKKQTPILLTLLLCMTLLGCDLGIGGKFMTLNVQNQSQYDLSNIKLYACYSTLDGFDSVKMENKFRRIYLDSTSIDDTPKKETTRKRWRVNLPGHDGFFFFRCELNDTILEREFAYFSSGIVLDKENTLTILNDKETIAR